MYISLLFEDMFYYLNVSALADDTLTNICIGSQATLNKQKSRFVIVEERGAFSLSGGKGGR
jgi:hypothetical protein